MPNIAVTAPEAYQYILDCAYRYALQIYGDPSRDWGPRRVLRFVAVHYGLGRFVDRVHSDLIGEHVYSVILSTGARGEVRCMSARGPLRYSYITREATRC